MDKGKWLYDHCQVRSVCWLDRWAGGLVRYRSILCGGADTLDTKICDRRYLHQIDSETARSSVGQQLHCNLPVGHQATTFPRELEAFSISILPDITVSMNHAMKMRKVPVKGKGDQILGWQARRPSSYSLLSYVVTHAPNWTGSYQDREVFCYYKSAEAATRRKSPCDSLEVAPVTTSTRVFGGSTSQQTGRLQGGKLRNDINNSIGSHQSWELNYRTTSNPGST